MKLCYCDESGTGDIRNEPVAVMVGIVVDASRMHLTKAEWEELLGHLSELAKRQIAFLHTRDFYHGRPPYRGIEGQQRSDMVDYIIQWLGDRQHRIVYSAVTRAEFETARTTEAVPSELNSLWRFMGFHLMLAMQTYCQSFGKNKGHTIFVFDNEDREEKRFSDIVCRPQAWSDHYYGRHPKRDQLDQVVDVPYFGDDRDVVLLQVADFCAYFLRRYAELDAGVGAPSYYVGEKEKVTAWAKRLAQRSIDVPCMYRRVGRDWAHDVFFNLAPASIRSLACK